ncbi:transglycosylase SLT domain-containing protein [Patescibacteria group bacterium]|nr:transglycosylase SLT domain-containing protein [Patescibacteria group bacterium]
MLLVFGFANDEVEICHASMRQHERPITFARTTTCIAVALEAQRQNVDPMLMVELAYSESGFNHEARNKVSGCIGPMQVKPRWACPNKVEEGCDLIEAGVSSFIYWKKRKKTTEQMLCHYKSGNICTQTALKGAKRVLEWTKRLKEKKNEF